jgi:CLN3 protein.
MLRAPTSDDSSERGFGTTENLTDKQNQTSQPESPIVLSPQPLTMKERLRIVPSLLVYMIPLGLVFLFEYFINQGLVNKFLITN